jgi:hypothetical protein
MAMSVACAQPGKDEVKVADVAAGQDSAAIGRDVFPTLHIQSQAQRLERHQASCNDGWIDKI